jgi:glycosyltransferase involved in cell wall biosynthesis
MSDLSVVVPCYRQAHLLPDALDSIQAAASEASVEAVVVDDGSPDDVGSVVTRYPGFTLLTQPNSGLSAARNAGILASSGPLLLFLDSDDAIRPGMIETAVRTLETRPDLDVVHGLADVVSGTDPEVVTVFGGTDLHEDPFHTLLRGNIGPPNTFVVRRTALARSGLFEPSLRSCEDWDLWLRLAAAGARFGLVPQMRSVYRSAPGSMSRNIERMWRSGRRVLSRNAARHPGCAQCRDAVRQGERQFGEGFWPLVRDGLLEAESRTTTARVLATNPRLTWHQLMRKVRS